MGRIFIYSNYLYVLILMMILLQTLRHQYPWMMCQDIKD